jgi:hypothetical protein
VAGDGLEQIKLVRQAHQHKVMLAVMALLLVEITRRVAAEALAR